MYVVLTSSFYVLNVHRTTYKRLNSYLLIEKSILQFDPLTPREKVSSLCISPIISYKITVALTIIINHPITILVSAGIVTITNFKICSILSNISLIAGVDVTGYHPHKRQKEFSIHQISLFYSSES